MTLVFALENEINKKYAQHSFLISFLKSIYITEKLFK